MKQAFFVGILAVALGAVACTSTEQPQAPDQPHFVVKEGLLSVNFDHAEAYVNFANDKYYTGRGLKTLDSLVEDTLAYVHVPVYFDQAQDLRVWLLSGLLSTPKETMPQVRFALYAADSAMNATGQPLVVAEAMTLPTLKATAWHPHTPEASHPVLQVPAAGSYVLAVGVEPGDTRVFLDRLVLAASADFQPRGLGPAETHTSNRDSLRATLKPTLPPAWTFGVLYGGYTNQEETVDRVKRLLAEDYPIDAYWIDSWFWDYTTNGDNPGAYLSFVQDTVAFPDPGAMWSYMGDNHVNAGIWTWNTIMKTGNEAVHNDFKEKGYFKSVYQNTIGWHDSTSSSITGDIDFSNPEAAAYYKSKLKPFFDQGLDFVKLDRVSELDYIRTAYEMSQQAAGGPNHRGYLMVHMYAVDDPRHRQYPTMWTGDAKSAWDQSNYPDLGQYAMGAFKENIMMVADPLKTHSESYFLTNDTGGYNYFGSDDHGDELFCRWAQFSAFGPIMSCFSTADNPTANMPFSFGEEVQASYRKYTHLRLQLFPYIYSLAHRSAATGEYMIQGDGEHKTQYHFGPAVYVAPVHQPGVDLWPVHLPKGQWYFYYQDSFELMSGGDVEVPTDLSELPLFFKAGAVVPMRPYAGSVSKGSDSDLILTVFAGGESDFTLTEDDGATLAYQDGQLATTSISAVSTANSLELTLGPRQGTYEGMPESKTLTLRLVGFSELPSSLQVAGKTVPLTDEGAYVQSGTVTIDPSQEINISF